MDKISRESLQSRVGLLRHFEANGEVSRTSRTWDEASQIQKRGLLPEQLRSGYSNWFSVTQDKVWWEQLDASDGGSWSVDGVVITSHCVPYDRDIVRALYTLANPTSTYDRRV